MNTHFAKQIKKRTAIGLAPILFGFLFIMLNIGFLSATFAKQEIDVYAKADSLSYELQRQKVNQLLDERRARFGHFDESLKKKTGIFGLKTKKDMQASIDILNSIVQTDNHIFVETKKLLDFKDQQLDYKEFEKERIAELAKEYDSRINGYITTISKLQKEQERLTSENRNLKNNMSLSTGFFTFSLIGLIVLGVYTFRRNKKLNQLKIK